MTPEERQQIAALFDLTDAELTQEEIRVRCPSPDHEDNNPSCDINLAKGVYNCNVCAAGGSLCTLLEDGPSPEKEEEVVVAQPEFATQLSGECQTFLDSRGLVPSSLGVAIDTDKNGDLLLFPVKGPFQARNMSPDLKNGAPRYKTQQGKKGLFWASTPPPSGGLVFLTEGPLDALGLSMAGAPCAAAALGSSLSAEQAFELRPYLTLICFDSDGAGYEGAMKVSKKLSEFQAPHIVCELPAVPGCKDPGDLWQESPEVLAEWLQSILEEHQPDEQQYVFDWRTLQEYEPIATGFSAIDTALRGGWLPGVHVLLGETKAGKSSLALGLARTAARRGDKVLYLSTELSKREVWARITAGIEGAPAWADLEINPAILPSDCFMEQNRLARFIKVIENVPPQRLFQIARGFEPGLIVLDYLQEMAPDSASEMMFAMRSLSKRLAAFARDQAVPIIAVSSTARGAEVGGGAAKYCGDIEFVASSVSGLTTTGFGERQVRHWKIFLNRRGELGTATLDFDPARGVFSEKEEIAA